MPELLGNSSREIQSSPNCQDLLIPFPLSRWFQRNAVDATLCTKKTPALKRKAKFMRLGWRQHSEAGSWGREYNKGIYGPRTLWTSAVLEFRGETSKGRELQETLFMAHYEQECNLPYTTPTPLGHPSSPATGQSPTHHQPHFPLCASRHVVYSATLFLKGTSALPPSLFTGDLLLHLN